MVSSNKGLMQRYAMQYGTYMGLFWILKFILIPLGVTFPILILLFAGLTLCVPFLGYYYTKMYREQACNGRISFFHAWAFNLFLFICASMLAAVAHYLYFGVIDQGYIIGACRDMLETMEAGNLPGMDEYIAQLNTNIDMLEAMTPKDITLQLLINDIYYCSWMSIIIALIARKRNRPITPPLK